MGLAKRFEELDVWQTARELAQKVYSVSNRDAFARDFGLRDQMRRAAVSIMSNIAEGFESGTRPLFIKFLRYARGSAGEVRAQFYVALDVGYISAEEFAALTDLTEKCSRQLTRLIKYLETHPLAVRETGIDYETNVGT